MHTTLDGQEGHHLFQLLVNTQQQKGCRGIRLLSNQYILLNAVCIMRCQVIGEYRKSSRKSPEAYLFLDFYSRGGLFRRKGLINFFGYLKFFC